MVEIAWDLLCSVVVDVLVIWTGELLLGALTLGRRRPVFAFGKRGEASSWTGRQRGSALVGLLFWMGVALWRVT